MNKTVIYKEDAIKFLDDLENRIAKEEGWQEKCDGVFQAKELIANMITIEAEPVRHGQWKNTHIGTIECSECGHGYNLVGMFVFYCPHCGAKMDLGKD